MHNSSIKYEVEHLFTYLKAALTVFSDSCQYHLICLLPFMIAGLFLIDLWQFFIYEGLLIFTDLSTSNFE